MEKLTITPVLTLAILLFSLTSIKGALAVEYVPVDTIEYQLPAAAGVGVLSEPFKVCGDCSCCEDGNTSNCGKMKCCFGIVCNLPGKPFDQCSFMPKACNCNNCS